MTELARGAHISEIGEHVLIEAIARRLGSADAVLGIGDDAAVLATPDGRCAVSTDIFVQDVHFRLNWSSAHDIGRRVAAGTLADIAAMGAAPRALVVSLALPPDTEVGWVLDLTDGIAAECESANASVVGGDVSSGPIVVASATALGDLQGRDPVTHGGAKPGDVVAVAGRLGWAAAGLTVLSRGFSAPRKVISAHRAPEPPYLAGQLAASAGATAMLDISDGLVADLGHIAAASGVAIDIESAQLRIDDPVRDAASAFTMDPLIWVLTGGDDHGLVATFTTESVIPRDFTVIGTVSQVDGDAVITVDGQARPELRGFDHYA
ncbi:MAG: thiamine-monophosphate kinase [Actinomycetes bacterium]|jgi:thiamine-monophosphate kinase